MALTIRQITWNPVKDATSRHSLVENLQNKVGHALPWWFCFSSTTVSFGFGLGIRSDVIFELKTNRRKREENEMEENNNNELLVVVELPGVVPVDSPIDADLESFHLASEENPALADVNQARMATQQSSKRMTRSMDRKDVVHDPMDASDSAEEEKPPAKATPRKTQRQGKRATGKRARSTSKNAGRPVKRKRKTASRSRSRSRSRARSVPPPKSKAPQKANKRNASKAKKEKITGDIDWNLTKWKTKLKKFDSSLERNPNEKRVILNQSDYSPWITLTVTRLNTLPGNRWTSKLNQIYKSFTLRKPSNILSSSKFSLTASKPFSSRILQVMCINLFKLKRHSFNSIWKWFSIPIARCGTRVCVRLCEFKCGYACLCLAAKTWQNWWTFHFRGRCEPQRRQ